jgi:hypothetical protein
MGQEIDSEEEILLTILLYLIFTICLERLQCLVEVLINDVGIDGFLDDVS